MSSCDRRSLLIRLGALAAALPVTACGFTPAYAPGAAANSLRNSVVPDNPPNRLAYSFIGQIEARLGPATSPRYRLSYRISTRKIELAVTTEGSILRYNIVGEVNYSLIDLKTGATLFTGRANSFTASAATQATIAAQSAEQDANERLMIILADQVVAHLTAAASSFAAPTAAQP
ncbi:LPS assembly lipoprotein LptE [Tabrizicola sp. J26]|uniref:LPS assembly lipoprotein LptE n=1 Tax=Alitabrizicola rongguiensis TaxID=2909234 RepID=UPI001F1AB0E5|nr:LPS assembly lipoprotein LptE [Tabrizicola rongguiensis]MCF1710579.1 LPS assembly lipoprotein LptE [Tabrizicola rongguiensis]